MDASIALVREAEASGFTVEQTNGGHVRYKAPDGAIIIAGGTSSDHRAAKNNRARLRQHGLGQANPKAEDRVAKAKEAQESASTSLQVLEHLQSHPGEAFPAPDLAQVLGLTTKQVSNAVQWLRSKHPKQIVRGDDGWAWSDVLAAPPAEQEMPEEQREQLGLPTASRRQGLSHDIVEYLKSLGGGSAEQAEIARAISAPKTSIASALHNLTKSNPDIVRAGRGRYAYRPNVPSEKDRARARLRLIEREMRDLPAGVARTVLNTERDRLQQILEAPEVIAAPEPPKPEPVVVQTPAIPVAPITVMPTELPAGTPSLMEAVTTMRLSPDQEALVAKDENGKLWCCLPMNFQMPSVTFGSAN